MSGSYDIKLDSNNSIKLNGKANFYNTVSYENVISQTTGNSKILKNTTDRFLQTNSDKTSLSGSILFKHRFKKARRTFSINSSWGTLQSTGNNILQSTNVGFSNGNASSAQKINQTKKAASNTGNFATNIAFTEPLSKNYSLELSHQLTYNYGTNNQFTYGYSNTTGKYDLMIDSLSNDFKQSITINKPSVKISYNTKKIKYNFGSGFGFTNYDLIDQSINKDYKRNFTNFFPNASFTYSYKANHSIRFNYNGSTSQPSINQLQPLRNNVDYFYQYVGNPDLKPSFSNSVGLSHNSYNFLKEMSFYQSLNFRTTKNAISNSRITDLDSGKTITKPVNTNGNYSVSFYSNFWFKIKKLNMSVGFGPNVNFNKFVSIINNNNSFSNTLNSGFNIYLSKSKEKKYDISISDRFSNNRNNTAENNEVKKFNTNSINIDATVYYKKTWSIATDYEFFARQKTADFTDNLTYQIWNIRLQHTFKKDEFTAYVMARDLLNQNIGINRNFYGNTVTEERNDRLKRYGMIGFTWNFKNKAASKN
jgi:hypothetical protein